MNAHELDALANLLQRTPMSPAEGLFVTALFQRLDASLKKESQAPVVSDPRMKEDGTETDKEANTE